MRANELEPGDQVIITARATAALRGRGEAPHWLYGPQLGTVLRIGEGSRGGRVRLYVEGPRGGAEVVVGLHAVHHIRPVPTPVEEELESAFAAAFNA